MFCEQSPTTRNVTKAAVLALTLLLLAGLVLWLGSQVLAQAPASATAITTTCTVDAAGTGTHPTIQAAVDDVACTDIEVAAGFYTENVTITRSLWIHGAGPALTTVDGAAANSVFVIPGGHVNVGIVGMTIQNGAAERGAGIRNDWGYSHLTLHNLDIVANHAGEIGGGVYNLGVMTMTQTTIYANYANAGAGLYSSIHAYEPSLIADSEISQNVGLGTTGGMVVGGPVEIRNTAIISNSAEEGVGGMAAGISGNPTGSRPVTMTDCLIQGNIGSQQGGLRVYTHLTIDSSEIISNVGARTRNPAFTIDGGGIYVTEHGVLTITNSTVRGNELNPLGLGVSTTGGGIFVSGYGGRLLMVNSTVSNNKPGGVYDSWDSPLVASRAVVEISNSEISDNRGTGISGGGTTGWDRGQLTVVDSLIQDNIGRGVYYTGDITLTRSLVSGNTAGGLDVENGTISYSTISNNSSPLQGAGITSHGDLRIVYTTISDNTGTEQGGGIYNDVSADLTIDYSTIRGNSTEARGGGIYSDGEITIQSSTINSNTSEVGGGGIYSTNWLSMTNSTVSGNAAAKNGGGLLINEGSFQMQDSTVAFNTADSDGNNTGDGGGIFIAASAGEVTMVNNILAANLDNSPTSGVHPDCHGTFTSSRWNIVGAVDTSACILNGTINNYGSVAFPLDPALEPLVDNGGPTWTHALQATSPAVDFNQTTCSPEDQRGANRPKDGDDTPPSYCDAGAFELGGCGTPRALTLSIERDGENVLLNWIPGNFNREFVVARVTDYIQRTDLISHTVQELSYVDYGAIGDPQTDYFYTVRGENACGERSYLSNIVGEIDVLLGTEEAAHLFAATGILRSLHFAIVSLPLEGANLPTTADALADYIDPDGSVRGVAKWNPLDRPRWTVRRVHNPFGDDFDVFPGDVLLLGMTASAPETFAWVGDVPADGTIQNNLVQNKVNAIIVPLDQSGAFTMDADGLAAAIGGVARVAVWHPVEQRWYIRNTNSGSGPNFPTQLGMPYVIYANDTAPLVWP